MSDFFKRFTGEGDNLESLSDLFQSNFFNLKRPAYSDRDIGWTPQTDMYETEREIVVIVELAGIEDNDVSVILDSDILLIRGIRRERQENNKRHYHDMEIEYGPFQKVLKLPSPVDPEKVLANYRCGILEIRMLRSTQKCSKTEIKIK